MKLYKHILLLCFILVLSDNGFGQAAVDIPITAKDYSGCYWIMSFGLDLSATDSIDSWLGEGYESCYHPPPHCSPFFATLLLPPFQGVLYSCRDYRAPGNPPAFPFTGNIQYSIGFYSLDYPVTISWDLPPEISPTSTIQDTGGGGIINKTFSGNDSLVVIDSTISQLYIFVDYDNVIPVELTSFTVSVLQNEKTVQLNWTTATETNNSGFEILHFTQYDNHWNTIGFVPGFGTTTEPKSYSFVDDNVTAGIYIYRLKQIDFDGSFEYSNEIEVEVDFTPEEFLLYQNYPNPFNPNTVIRYQLPVTSNVSLKIYDALGNEVAILVNEEKQPGIYEVEFSVGQDSSPDKASGIYFYQLNAGSITDTKKMILAK